MKLQLLLYSCSASCKFLVFSSHSLGIKWIWIPSVFHKPWIYMKSEEVSVQHHGKYTAKNHSWSISQLQHMLLSIVPFAGPSLPNFVKWMKLFSLLFFLILHIWKMRSSPSLATLPKFATTSPYIPCYGTSKSRCISHHSGFLAHSNQL